MAESAPGLRTITAAHEALALSGNPLASRVLGSGPGIMRLADNDGQREDLYLPVLRGERSAAFAFTEALRADGKREPTQAVRTTLADGSRGFEVSGAKGFRHRRRGLGLAGRGRQRTRRGHRPARGRPRCRRSHGG